MEWFWLQQKKVRKVKRSESGLILDPVTLLVDATIGDAVHLMKENRIGGIPIVDSAGKLVGILTNRDLRFEDNFRRKVSELMTKENLITAPEGTDLKKAQSILRKYKIEKLPSHGSRWLPERGPARNHKKIAGDGTIKDWFLL